MGGAEPLTCEESMRALKSLALIATLTSAGAASAQPVFREDFENGTSRWVDVDSNGIAVSSDSGGACSTNYQHETIPAEGGRVFLSAPLP